jgi:hypothetical protein
MRMRFFLLAVVVVATPVLAQALPGQQASRLVLLAGEEAPKAIVGLPPPPPAVQNTLTEDPFTPIYRRMVSLQLQLLDFQRVSLAGPLAVTLFGGTAALAGVVMLLMGAASYGFFIVGLVVLGGSSLPLLIGLPWLVGTLNTNARISREIEKIKREQRALMSRPIEPLDGAVLGTF